MASIKQEEAMDKKDQLKISNVASGYKIFNLTTNRSTYIKRVAFPPSAAAARPNPIQRHPIHFVGNSASIVKAQPNVQQPSTFPPLRMIPVVPAQRKPTLSLKDLKATTTESNYNADLIEKIRQLEAENRKLTQELNHIGPLKSSMDKIFTTAQMRKLLNPDFGVHWDPEDISNAMCLYHASTKIYKHLYATGYPLPCTSTLHKKAQYRSGDIDIYSPCLDCQLAGSCSQKDEELLEEDNLGKEDIANSYQIIQQYCEVTFDETKDIMTDKKAEEIEIVDIKLEDKSEDDMYEHIPPYCRATFDETRDNNITAKGLRDLDKKAEEINAIEIKLEDVTEDDDMYEHIQPYCRATFDETKDRMIKDMKDSDKKAEEITDIQIKLEDIAEDDMYGHIHTYYVVASNERRNNKVVAKDIKDSKRKAEEITDVEIKLETISDEDMCEHILGY